MPRFRRFLALAAAASLVVVVLSAAPSSGAPRERFDWGDNRACAVLASSDVRCFPTEAEMERATGGEQTDARSSLLATYCAGSSTLWLYLYEHSSFGGRVVKFRDALVWQNLSTWGFNDLTSSWKNDTLCTAYLAVHANGGGSWLSLSASSSATSMPAGWNDVASSFYITA